MSKVICLCVRKNEKNFLTA